MMTTTRKSFINVVLSMVLLAPNAAKAFQVSAMSSTTHRSSSPSSLAAFTVGEAIDSFYQTQPYVSAFLTCSVKASAADFFAQTKQVSGGGGTATTTSASESTTTVLQKQNEEASPEVDVSRNLAFLVYGGIYQGLCQQFMYSTLFPAWFGDMPMLESVALQVFTDMALIGPFLCLPTAYAVKSLFTCNRESGLPALSTLLHAVQEGLDKYWEDVMHRQLLLKYWALWIPVQSLTFGVIPQHYRVAFVAAVSFFWVFILSSVAAQETKSAPTATTQGPLQLKGPPNNNHR